MRPVHRLLPLVSPKLTRPDNNYLCWTPGRDDLYQLIHHWKKQLTVTEIQSAVFFCDQRPRALQQHVPLIFQRSIQHLLKELFQHTAQKNAWPQPKRQ